MRLTNVHAAIGPPVEQKANPMFWRHTKSVTNQSPRPPAAAVLCSETSYGKKGWNKVRLSHRKHVTGNLRGSVSS